MIFCQWHFFHFVEKNATYRRSHITAVIITNNVINLAKHDFLPHQIVVSTDYLIAFIKTVVFKVHLDKLSSIYESYQHLV